MLVARFWIVRSYQCGNTAAGCRFARDVPVAEADYRRWGGVCRGADGSGCGQPLRRAAQRNLLGWMLAAGLLAVAAAAGGRRLLFPPPIEHVAFAQAETRTDDRRGSVAIELVREHGLDRAAEIRIAFVDGSAKAGADYLPGIDTLVFAAGARRQRLLVQVLPDVALARGERHFQLTLTNVRGMPAHLVRIEPSAVARSELAQAVQQVRAASVVAKDIADYVVRRRVLDALLSQYRENPAEFERYKTTWTELGGNLSRAREAYLQFQQDLKQQPPAVVLQALDQVVEDLKRRGFDQQSQAVAVMKRHQQETRSGRGVDMDRWVNELSTVVPQPVLPRRDAAKST